MAKIRITLEIEARPYTEEEAKEEAEMCGLKPEDMIDEEIDAFGIGQCLTSYVSQVQDEMLAGSDLMVKLGEAKLISATEEAEVS
jgi:hypothetical protein